MTATRVLAVIAAAFLVTAVAIATFGSESISLGQAIYILNQDMLVRLPAWVSRNLGMWAWTTLFEPLLVRPAWLLPAAAGIVCSGLSVTLASRNTGHRSRRRS